MPVFKQYKKMWDECYDFKGLCSIKDFILAIVGHLIIIGLFLTIFHFYPFRSIKVFFLIYGFFSFFPVLALCCRRFHDAGKSGWWTFLVFLGIGFIFCFCMTLESKTFEDRHSSAPPAIYGPPSYFEEETLPTEAPQDDYPDIVQCLYGPPEAFQ